MRYPVLLASLLCALLVSASALVAQPGPPPLPQATVQVDCDAGDTLADALDTRADELTIEFTGTCAEELVITRDRLTIRGLDASATVTDDPATVGPAAAFLLEGADVVFRDFTIDGAASRGIRVQRSSGVLIENLTVVNSGTTGLTVEESSSAHVVDSSFTGATFAGVAAWGNSNVTLTGGLDVSSNFVGLLLSSGSTVQNRGGTGIVADNQIFGAAAQLGATGQLPPLSATGVDLGLAVFGGDYFGSIDVSANIGVFMGNHGGFDGGADVTSTGLGFLVEEDSTALIRGGTVAGPAAALSVTNGVVEADVVNFDGNIQLGFNAQALFNASTTTGAVVCAPTAVAGGSISCPAPLLAETLRLEAPGGDRVELPHSLPFVQPE